MNSQELQGKYLAAMARITTSPDSEADKRRMPIFQREPAVSEQQSINDAATALALLWKISKR